MHDNWYELITDLKLTNKDQADKLYKLRCDYLDTRNENSDLRMQLVFMKRKLRKEHLTVNPVDTGDSCYECGNCCVILEGDWEYCPGCGQYIDWDAIESDNWYEDEGERFLRNEVYEPLRERLLS